MIMGQYVRKGRAPGVLLAGWAVVVAFGAVSTPAWAQQNAAARPGTPAASWYGYAPSPMPGAATSRSTSNSIGGAASGGTVAPVAPGWAGYAPAAAWVGYAPASAPVPVVIRPAPRRVVLAPGPARRRAASEFVNHNAPQYSYALASYREFGSGRNIPLAKPWLAPPP
jgi:hypothetical protein